MTDETMTDEAGPVDDGPEAPPARVEIGVTASETCAQIRVVDAVTGDRIDKVVMADAVAGKVRRYAVENGGLVIEQNRPKIIEEDRVIRIEWLSGKRRNSF